MLIGLLGKANVGKSTFFNAATDLGVAVANYPFTTIQANVGIAYLRVQCVCKEFNVKDNPIHSFCIDGNRFIPVNLIDVAGLVPGAHQGKGLGNKFLDDARQADALIHVIDASASTDIEGHPIDAGSGDVMQDIKFVEQEFDLWISSLIKRDWEKAARDSGGNEQKLEQMIVKRLSGLSIAEVEIKNSLNKLGLGKKHPSLWSDTDFYELSKTIRLKSKPIIVAANKADISTAEKYILLTKEIGLEVIPCSSEIEILLKKASKKDIVDYLPGDSSFIVKNANTLTEPQKKALHVAQVFLDRYKSTGIQDILKHVCLTVLKYIVVYPVEDDVKLMDKKGNVLPESKLIPKGYTTKDLAFSIHSDIGKGFLYAIDVRTRQRLGSDYALKNNDVVKIVSTMTRG